MPHVAADPFRGFRSASMAFPAGRDTAPATRLSFDKVQHVVFGFLFTLGGQYTLVNKGSMRERRALPLSAGFSAAVGVGKELYDWKRGSHRRFDRNDLVADAVGIAAAVLFIVL